MGMNIKTGVTMVKMSMVMINVMKRTKGNTTMTMVKTSKVMTNMMIRMKAKTMMTMMTMVTTTIND